jgi:DNA-binding CsgD family transcriptional regulator
VPLSPVPDDVPGGRRPATVFAFLELLGNAESMAEYSSAAIEAGRLIPGTRSRFSDVTVVRRAGWEHPATEHIRASADASPVAISRVMSEPAFRATSLYRELHRWEGVTDELLIPIPHEVVPASLAIGRKTWGFTDEELLVARQLQQLLTVTYTWCRQREVVRAGVPMAVRLARSHGRELLVSNPAGDLWRLDGTPVELDGGLCAAIRDATRLAGHVVGEAEPGSALVEVTSASADGEPFTLRVHAPDVEGDLLPVTLERSRSSVTASELARHGLTPRQAEVMTLVLNGATNGAVANALGISERTVEKHVIAAYDKLGVRTRTKALLAVLD